MDSGHFFLQSSYIQQDYQFIFYWQYWSHYGPGQPQQVQQGVVIKVSKDHAKELAESGGKCLEDIAMIVGINVSLDHENHGSDDDGTIQC